MHTHIAAHGRLAFSYRSALSGMGLSFFLVVLLVPLLLSGALFAPPAVHAASKDDAQQEQLHVLASTFPVYLFARNVAQHRPYVHIELLVPAQNGCPHHYAPTPSDLQKLARAHVLIINGLGFEDFLLPALKKVNAGIVRIDSSKGIAPLPAAHMARNTPAEEKAHAACDHAGHEHDSACGHSHGHTHGQWNPHIFAGPAQAAIMVWNIAEGLAKADPDGAESYRRAAQEYMARLLSVGRRLKEIGDKASRKGVVLQHDALAYVIQAAGLEVLDLIESGEGEQPSAARLMEIIGKIKAQNPVIIAGEPQYSDKTAQTIARETGIPAVSLDPVASGPADAPLSYYEAVMARNCQTLERYFD